MGKLNFMFCFCLALTIWSESIRANFVEEFEIDSDSAQQDDLDDNDTDEQVVNSLEVPEDNSVDPYFVDSTELTDPTEDDLDDNDIDEQVVNSLEVPEDNSVDPYFVDSTDLTDPTEDDLEDYHYHYDYHWHNNHHHWHWHWKPFHITNKGSCSCVGEKCSCCVEDHHYSISVHGKQFYLDACVDVTYLHEDDKYDIEVTSNGKELVHEDDVDLSDSTDLCYDVPDFSGVRACAKFYDVSRGHACIKITGKIRHRLIDMRIDVGIACFHIHCNKEQSAPKSMRELLLNRHGLE
ncbi:hypothetical protein ACF0H5_024341 [Mactra antiquata]